MIHTDTVELQGNSMVPAAAMCHMCGRRMQLGLLLVLLPQHSALQRQLSSTQALERCAMANTSGAAVDADQQPAATGMLDLPGALLMLIWQQLGQADRKSLCCAARGFRACEGAHGQTALLRILRRALSLKLCRDAALPCRLPAEY